MKKLSIRLGWFLSGLAVLAACGGAIAMAAGAEEKKTVEPMTFNIPAQPLATALDAYAATIGRDVYYDGALVSGRHSSVVRGMFTPDMALRVLLQGTGLVARDTGDHSFTIAVPQESREAVAVSSLTERADFQRYFAAVQAGVRRALCRDPKTRPGGYQLIVRLWLTGGGAVFRAGLLNSTGDSRRDAAFSAALRSVRVEEPVPPGMPSTITMMVFPRASGAARECESSPGSGEGR